MYIIFHILNKKGAGFAIIPFQAIWFLIGTGPVLIVNVAMQEEKTVFCMNCGQKISATATFCNYCGAKVE